MKKKNTRCTLTTAVPSGYINIRALRALLRGITYRAGKVTEIQGAAIRKADLMATSFILEGMSITISVTPLNLGNKGGAA